MKMPTTSKTNSTGISGMRIKLTSKSSEIGRTATQPNSPRERCKRGMAFEPVECHPRAHRKDQKHDEHNNVPRDAPPQAVVAGNLRSDIAHGAQGTTASTTSPPIACDSPVMRP